MPQLRGKVGREPQIPELMSTHPSHETRVTTIESYLPTALQRRSEKGCPVLRDRDLKRLFHVVSEAIKSAEVEGKDVDWAVLSRRLQ